MRTAVYVDGFNLFYRALRGTPYRWLDLLALSQRMLDVALVVSNDSDLAEGIKLARQRGKPVGVANPSPDTSIQMNFKLNAACSFRRRIEIRDLKASQLPDNIPGTSLSKPTGW